MKRLKLLLFLLFLSINTAYSQTKMDSLWNTWQDDKNSKEARILALQTYSEEYNKINPDSGLYYSELALDFAIQNKLDDFKDHLKTVVGQSFFIKGDYEKAREIFIEAKELAIETGDKKIEAIAIFDIGMTYYRIGEYEKALSYYDSSKTILNELDEKKHLANVLNSEGIIHIIQKNYLAATQNLERAIELYEEIGILDESPYNNYAILKVRQGDYQSAIQLYMKSLKITEQLNDELSKSYALSNIANLYYELDNPEKFFDYSNEALEIRRKFDDKIAIAFTLANMGVVYYENDMIPEALEYLNECLPIAEELQDKRTLSTVLTPLALIYSKQGKHKLAKEYIERTTSIYEDLGTQKELIRAKIAYGQYYKGLGKMRLALNSYIEALEISQDTDVNLTNEIAKELYEMYLSFGNYDKALNSYELYISTKDSINNEKNQREIILQEFKYEYDKKALADSLAFAAQQQIQETKLEKTQSDRRSLFIGLLVVLAFTIIVIARNRKINSQKETIENQNYELQDLNENLEEKVAERTKELKESDERYTYALEASSDGIWDYHVQSDKIKFSPAIYTMLGFEPYEFPETREAVYKLLHAEDLKIAKRTSHELFLTENSEEFLKDEYRLMGKDGATVWVQVKGKIVERDENNNPVRIVGTHTNITESKLRNQETLATILRTEDAERSRISKDIHDGLQQTLTISFLNFNGLKKHLIDFTEELKEKYNLGFEYLQKSISESREVAHTLMPKSIMDYGVLSACQRLVDDMNKSNEKTAFSFYHNLKSERLPNHQIEITLYRILQESINNIVKYAHASNVDIQLKDYDDMYMLTVEDNGVGFDTEILQKEGKGLGFSSMKNRLDAINGYLEIDSEKGEGTTILVQIDKAA